MAIQHLSNNVIHELLISLSQREAIAFRNIMQSTLEDFSVRGERQRQPSPCTSNRPDGRRILYRAFSSDSSMGTKIVMEPPIKPDGTKDPLRGTILVMDAQGTPSVLLDAEEVTGYRTSMNVMVPFSWRKYVDKIVIFGTGMQALWHCRLLLRLRGSEIKSITFVGFPGSQADELLARIAKENDAYWKHDVSVDFLDMTASDFQGHIEQRLSDADCLFCTTPSKKYLFSAPLLANRLRSTGRKPFISAIGSWQPDMIELDPELLQDVIASGGYNPETGAADGVLLVDDREFALVNSGEMVQSKVSSSNLVEIGWISALINGKIEPASADNVSRTQDLVSEGFIVYKSIGVSTTDLTVAAAIQSLLQEKNGCL